MLLCLSAASAWAVDLDPNVDAACKAQANIVDKMAELRYQGVPLQELLAGLKARGLTGFETKAALHAYRLSWTDVTPYGRPDLKSREYDQCMEHFGGYLSAEAK